MSERMTAEEKLVAEIVGRVVNAPCSFGHTNPVRMCSSCGPWPDPVDLVRAYAAHVSGALDARLKLHSEYICSLHKFPVPENVPCPYCSAAALQQENERLSSQYQQAQDAEDDYRAKLQREVEQNMKLFRENEALKEALAAAQVH